MLFFVFFNFGSSVGEEKNLCIPFHPFGIFVLTFGLIVKSLQENPMSDRPPNLEENPELVLSKAGNTSETTSTFQIHSCKARI